MISSILAREQIKRGDSINILWTPCDNVYFEKFITHKLKHKIFQVDHLYFGQCIPELIICNNKITFYEKISKLSIFLHCPVLVIDHNSRPNLIDEEKSKEISKHFVCSVSLALDKQINESWGKTHDHVLNYEANDMDNHDLWQNILYKTTKMVFKYDR
jgi:hypothetical protein